MVYAKFDNMRIRFHSYTTISKTTIRVRYNNVYENIKDNISMNA